MPKETLRYLRELRSTFGMTNKEFRQLHHFGPRASVKTHETYCGAVAAFGHGGNRDTRERLRVVLEWFRKRGITHATPGNWQGSIAAARKAYPIVRGASKSGRRVQAAGSPLWDPSSSPGLPGQNATIDFWARVVWGGLVAGRTAGGLTQVQLGYLLDRAVWAATEIHPNAEWKYFRQCYYSEDVKKRLERGLIQPRRPTQATLKKGLRHEHVIPRECLKRDLLRAMDEAEVRKILRGAIACVVTVPEEKALNNDSHCDGWGRYRRAQIRVWDRKSQKYL